MQHGYTTYQEWSSGYGLLDEDDSGLNMLDVPTVQLTELVERYRPAVVKLDCEGCEHYVLEQLPELPRAGVKKIAVEFHEVRGYDPNKSLTFLEGKLGRAIETENFTKTLLGREKRFVTVYWSL